MKKGLRLLFIFALLITLVACGDREIPTFDDILNQTVDVGSDEQNWEDLLENLADNETPVEKLIIEVDDNVNYDVPGTYNVTITVTDESDNVASVTFTVSVEDNEKPVITLVGGASISLIAGESFTDLGATYTDNVDGTGNATVSGSVNTAVAGTYTLTYNYIDAAGNAADPVTRTVTVTPLDTEAPVITLTGDAVLTVEAGATFTDPGATFSDNLDGTGAAIASGSVDTSALGSYTLTYNYTDAQGNAATPVTRTVNVVDTTAPVITVAQATYTVEVGSTFTLPTATASDNLDADATVTATGTVDASTVGSYTLTYTHSDSEGNAATAVTVTVVVEDTTAPVVTLTGDATVTLEAGVTFTDAGATATDNYDSTATVVVSGTVNNAALGTYTLTYTSTDASGNVGTATRTVTVVDTTAPVITVTGGENITVQIGETYTELGATFTDNLDAAGNATVATTSDTVDTATVGTYTITYTVTDSAGNTATATRTVIVSDTPPRLAQFAPKEGDTLVLGNYFKIGQYELFLLNYSSKALLVIFDGQELIDELVFGVMVQGPNITLESEELFLSLFRVSDQGFLVTTRNYMNGELGVVIYDFEAKEVVTGIPRGELRVFNQTPNQNLSALDLNAFGSYFYVVKSGEDRGIYKFNDDLTLNKITAFEMDYTSIFLPVYTDKFAVVELMTYVPSFSIKTYIIDAVNEEVLESYNYSTNNYFMLGEYFGYTYYDNSKQANSTTLKVWKSLESSESLDIDRFYFFGERTVFSSLINATSIAITLYDVDNANRQLRFYDETFTVIEQHIYGVYSYSVEKIEDYIVILDRDNNFMNWSLKAYKNDGSAPINADFGIEASNISANSSYVTLDNYSIERPFSYIYSVKGYENNVAVEHNAIYFQNGEFVVYEIPLLNVSPSSDNYFSNDLSKLILTHVETIFDFDTNTDSSKLIISIYDFETKSVIVTETFEFDYNLNFTARDGSVTNEYALLAYGSDSNNYQALNNFILINLSDGTSQLGSLDAPTSNSFIREVKIDGDNIEIRISDQLIKTTMTDFLDTYTIESAFGGGPNSSFYLIENIINDDDLYLELSFGMEGPLLKITWNGVLIKTLSVINSNFEVFVYDVEGTENDKVFISLPRIGVVYDLSNLEVEYNGIVTNEGFLSLDSSYNETLGELPILSSMRIDYFRFRVMN